MSSVFPPEALADERGELLDIEVEDAGDQAEDEEILALVLGGAADGLDGGGGDRHADRGEALVVGVGFDVVGVVDQHAALAERGQMALVAVLVEGDEEVGLVAG